MRGRKGGPPEAPADAEPASRDSGSYVLLPARRERIDSDGLVVPVQPIAGVRVQRISVVIVTVLAFAAAAWIASALWAGLLLGVLTAFAIEPAYRRLLVSFPRRRTLAAGITVTLVSIVAVGLLAAVGTILFHELIDGFAWAQQLLRGGAVRDVLRPETWERLAAMGIPPELITERITRLADRAAELASGLVSLVLGSTLHWGAGLLIGLITMFYALKERRPVERQLEQLLPLHPRTTREFFDEFRKFGRGTLIGSALAAVVQGVLATIGFALGGVERALLLGVLTAVASLVPVVGTLLVWVPVGVVLIAHGRPAAGIFELVWGVLVTTSLVDYVLRPILVGRESRSHPLLFLVGLIGGVEVLGGIGIIAGPLIMAFFASALRIYRREVIDSIRDEVA